MKPRIKLIGIVVILGVLRLVLTSPTVASYDLLLLLVGVAAIGLLLVYEFTQESSKLNEIGEQMFQILYPSFVFFVVIYVVINAVIFPARVNGTSMVPTYVSGDLVAFLMIGTPNRYDVVFVNVTQERTNHYTDEFMLKRIVGVAGDTLDIVDGQLIVNGMRVVEPYVSTGMVASSLPCFSPVNCRTVPEGMVFVMGDNRNASIDSRSYGLVPTDDILGRIVFNAREVWPW